MDKKINDNSIKMATVESAYMEGYKAGLANGVTRLTKTYTSAGNNNSSNMARSLTNSWNRGMQNGAKARASNNYNQGFAQGSKLGPIATAYYRERSAQGYLGERQNLDKIKAAWMQGAKNGAKTRNANAGGKRRKSRKNRK